MTADEILDRREQLKLTQAQLARLVGTRQQQVSKWESGVRPNRKFLKRLREVLTSKA